MGLKHDRGDPLDSNTHANYDIALMGYQMVAQNMADMDHTATDFDVYAQLMQMSANAPDDDIQAMMFESGQIAMQRMNGNNDD